MFSLDDTIPENFKDKIGIILKKITAIETNTKKKKEHVCELINLGKKNKYLFFDGYTGRYFISKVGGSYIYDVPKNKRGNLKKFKGKTIRIICIASGRNFCRSYMAGII
jgi:hypothetical protein